MWAHALVHTVNAKASINSEMWMDYSGLLG